MKTQQEILNALPYFTGAENYYKHPFLNYKLILTDGTFYIRDVCEAYWLFDIIAQQAKKHLEFIVYLKKLKDDTWLFKAAAFDNNRTLYAQKIPYSDFPLSTIKLFYMNGVCYLPSEH